MQMYVYTDIYVCKATVNILTIVNKYKYYLQDTLVVGH